MLKVEIPQKITKKTKESSSNGKANLCYLRFLLFVLPVLERDYEHEHEHEGATSELDVGRCALDVERFPNFELVLTPNSVSAGIPA
jgi:hypothetical protein